MSFLTSNFAVVAVAFAASLMAWMFGGTIGSLLVSVVPWLAVLLIEVILFFPQRRAGENSYEARARVWSDLRRDPLVLVAVGFLLLLAIPFVNNGLCEICDAEKIAQGMSADPPVPLLPFCVNRIDHLNVVLWFVVAMLVMIATKHSLNSKGKRMVVEMIVWNGAVLAVLGFVQSAMDAPGPLWDNDSGVSYGAREFFSTFGYPNMGGDYFTVLFGLSVALWRNRYEEVRAERESKDISSSAAKRPRQFWRKHYFMIPALLCLFAALNTLSRAAIILATISLVVYYFHAMISFLSRLHRAQRVRVGVWSLMVLAMMVFFSLVFMPENIQKEVDTLGTTEVLDRVTGRGQYHVRVATEIWKDYPIFGCGGWGYIHACIPRMTEEELKDIQMVGGINVHNDYLQFLAEHGVVGFGALAAMVIMLLWPIAGVWRRLAKEARFDTSKNRPPKPTQIFALPAPAFCVMFSALCTLIHAFGDCPFRSPAVLSLFFISLASLPGFVPNMRSFRNH